MRNKFILLSIVFAALIIAPKAFAAPPPGFQTSLLVGSGLNNSTGLEIAPDGRIFIVEQGGGIRIYKHNTLLERHFDELPALADGDRGLLGIAFDPDFHHNHYVYFYYVDLDLRHKVVRFNAEDDIGKDGPVLIYNSNSIANKTHAGGTIQFGPDGKLYISIGDSGVRLNAQNLSNPLGKILRINKDGSIPSDNPFVGQPDKRPEIWAYGFRNPFRFQFDPATGDMYVGDVGESTWEEINKVVKGGNYGWPIAEGFCDTCGSINPVYAYQHTTPNSATVVVGPIHQGSMFFADYVRRFIKKLTFNPDGTVDQALDFEPSAGAVTDLKIGPDGSLYYVTIFPGRLYKITYTQGNQYPIVAASADATAGTEPLTVNFSSAGSLDPEGATLTYNWNFGDGTTSSQANPTKVYSNRGEFEVQLAVSDGQNTSLSNVIKIKVGVPPALTINTPVQGALYRAGDTINYSSQATDRNGQAIPDSNFITEIIFHHNTHMHPFVRPTISRTGGFTIPTTGEVSDNVWYEIIVTAKDSDGVSTTKSVTINPRKSNINLSTSPAGLSIYVDGTPTTTPISIKSVVGIQMTMEAPTQELDGVMYEFDRWSDNGPSTRTISFADHDQNFIAYFRPVIPFNAEYYNNTTLSGAPALTRLDQNINFTWGNGSPDSLIFNDNFSARWTKTQFFSFGRYKFTTSTDDGVRLYIDDQLVIDKWINQASTSYSAIIDLTQGNHMIKMEYYEKGGGATAKLMWEMTPDQPTPTYPDYKAEYFANKNLSGEPVLMRNDAVIDNVWHEQAPHSSLPADQFSVRWTNTRNYEAGLYRFNISADDGVRLYIDGELVLDKWIDQAWTEYSIEWYLSGGEHEIKMEYYENFGGAIARLDFSQVPLSTGYTGKYWNLSSTGPSTQIPSTPPDMTRQDANIDFFWHNGSPDPSINLDRFVVQWTATRLFEDGVYRFTTTSDDGIRVYVDDELILNQWNDHALTTHTVNRKITPGMHNLRIEYYENAGGAIAAFNYEKLPIDELFSGSYFNNKTLSGTPVFTRQDAEINFSWGNTSPDSSINPDQFSVRWVQNRFFVAGSHKFTVTADDGVRFYVNGELLLDKWFDQAPTTYIVGKILTAGEHEIKMEYYENFGGATAKLMID